MAIKTTGKTGEKSNAKGMGGQAAQVKAALQKKGVPDSEIGGIIGNKARATGTAPGQPFYHNPSGKAKGKKR